MPIKHPNVIINGGTIQARFRYDGRRYVRGFGSVKHPESTQAAIAYLSKIESLKQSGAPLPPLPEPDRQPQATAKDIKALEVATRAARSHVKAMYSQVYGARYQNLDMTPEERQSVLLLQKIGLIP